jgi:membrane protein required for colicin V production
MNRFDLLLLIVLLLFTAVGAWRGFMREALSLAAWAIAGVLALMFAGRAAQWFPGFVSDPALRLALAFMVLFILIFLATTAFAWWLDRLFTKQRLWRVFNRLAGAAFGALRAGVLLVLAFLLAGLTDLPKRPWWRESQLAPVFVTAATWVKGYLPRDIARHIRYR